MSDRESRIFVVDKAGLPKSFPTHGHDPLFWEALGRAVATFGFLEEALARAIFAITATREYSSKEQRDSDFDVWFGKLERVLSDQLGGLTQTFCKEVKVHGKAKHEGFEELSEELEKSREIRNVLCHGSWRPPRADGSSLPFYFKKGGLWFTEYIDRNYLLSVQEATAEIAVEVINTVTAMGWQFPGSGGPGRSIFEDEN
jgi:hypothetical protein